MNQRIGQQVGTYRLLRVLGEGGFATVYLGEHVHLGTLAALLSRLYPDDIIVQEVSGVLGGRNDLMQFAFNGRRAVFEFFFTPDQVPQDLRLLELANAEVKVAILLDRSVNPAVAEEYVRKKPDHFPYLWLSELMMPSKEAECLIRLREIVDENAPVNRLRRVLSLKGGNIVEELLSKELEHIERILSDLSLPLRICQ